MSAHDTIDPVRSATILHAVLLPHKDALVRRWTEIVHGTYPFDTVGFLRTRKDRFANPVGYRTDEAAAALMDVIFSERPDEEKLGRAVDDIIRVRAIQEFSPEAAVGVIYAIKELVREKVMASAERAECLPALLTLESRIDAVALMAFGVYARCRETLHRMKVEEFTRRHSQVMRLAQRQGAGMDEADTKN